MDDYKLKKTRNQGVKFSMKKHLTESGFMRFSNCGSFLAFYANKELDKKKLKNGDFCKNRFCPMCAWRHAKKDALKISICMKYIEVEQKKDFIFLSLTAPNVTTENLKGELDKYNKAFKKMFERKDVKALNKGYIRKLEITYNRDRNDFHPHFHVVIAVNKSYFTDKSYIKQEKWLNMWRDVMDDQSITQVDVRRLKKNEQGKEINEIAKYSAKDSDMAVNQDVFDTFYNALKGRQVLTYNGLFKDASKLFKEKKLDGYIEIDETEYVYFLLYRWGKGEYVEAERRELTEKEKNEINRKLIDEIEVEEE